MPESASAAPAACHGPAEFWGQAEVVRQGTGAVVTPWRHDDDYGPRLQGEPVSLPGVFRVRTDAGGTWVSFVDHRATVAEVLRIAGLQGEPDRWSLVHMGGERWKLGLAAGVRLFLCV